MTYPIGVADSDSVNLGSNPSPPANGFADEIGTSRAVQQSEQPEFQERTAHIGRTEVGTAGARDRYEAIRRQLTPLRNRELHFPTRQRLTVLIENCNGVIRAADDAEAARMAALFARNLDDFQRAMVKRKRASIQVVGFRQG